MHVTTNSARREMPRRANALGAVFLLGCTGAFADPLRILCVGDSITQGGKENRMEFTYRLPLQDVLKRYGGVPFDFVGTRQAGVDAAAKWPEDFDADHEGYYGAKTSEVRDRLRVSLQKLPPPDIAIVHLGTNDLDSPGSFVDPLKEIVTLMRARNPHVVVLIGQVMPHSWHARWARFNVDRMVDQINTATAPVVVVNHDEGWDDEKDTYDGIHPGPSGQYKMAIAWFSAMQPYLPLFAPTHPARDY
jgi:lysophospholipase L1-like esterase